MNWAPVLPDVWRFRDSCNVYAVRGPGGMVIVDAGSGRWLETLHELPARAAALLCTHYFRDHSAGALAASRAGIPVHVPAYERAIFADAEEFHRTRRTYLAYDNLWEHFAPIESVPVAGVLRDYDRVHLAGIEIEIIPLPGATMSQVGFGLCISDGRKVVLCGEAIHSPGRVPRLAPFQYEYNDLSGAVNAYASAQRLRDGKPGALLPSLGDPILNDADGALAALQDTLRELCAVRVMPGVLNAVHQPPLTRVTDHVWLSANSASHNWFLISDSGKALVLDYGYNASTFAIGKPMQERRRALLHGIDGLQKQFGIDRVDVVLVSHFHDDHVCGIPLLQRLYGTQCWAAENFADILEHPEASAFPCTWPEPIRVERRLPFDEPVRWEEYEFRLAPMTGHTRFSALIGFEADGKRFAHTGDQYFFLTTAGSMNTQGVPTKDWRRLSNHVYRNGALLDSFAQSGRWMLDWRPQIVLQGHQAPFVTDDQFFQHIDEWTRDYQTTHQRAMPLDDSDTHFNVDSWAGWIWPYRIHLPTPAPAAVRVTVRNPFPRAATLEVRLVGPTGWTGTSATLVAAARVEVSCALQITPAGNCRRQPVALELIANGQTFGQIAEALVTVGADAF